MNFLKLKFKIKFLFVLIVLSCIKVDDGDAKVSKNHQSSNHDRKSGSFG